MSRPLWERATEFFVWVMLAMAAANYIFWAMQ
jgi:hypothetical protein